MICDVCGEQVDEFISCECGKGFCFECWKASPKCDICPFCKHELDFYQPTLSTKNKRLFIKALIDDYKSKRQIKRDAYFKRGEAIIKNLERIQTTAQKYGGHINNAPYDKSNGVPILCIYNLATKIERRLSTPIDEFKIKNDESFGIFSLTNKEVGETNYQAVKEIIRTMKATGIFCGGWSIPIQVSDDTRSLLEELYDALKSLHLFPIVEEYVAYKDFRNWNCNASKEEVIEYGKQIAISTNEVITCCDCGGVVRKVNESSMKCEDCLKLFCMKCGKELESEHACENDDLEEWKEILKTTRPCPRCGFRFTKKEHTCNDTYCTRCDTGFRYDTGKLIKHPFENPERKEAIERKRKEEKLDVYTMIYSLNISDVKDEILSPLHISSWWNCFIDEILLEARRPGGSYEENRFIVKKLRPHLLDLVVNVTRYLGSLDERGRIRGAVLTDKECKDLDEMFSSHIKRLRMFNENKYVEGLIKLYIDFLQNAGFIDRFKETLRCTPFEIYSNRLYDTKASKEIERLALEELE